MEYGSIDPRFASFFSPVANRMRRPGEMAPEDMQGGQPDTGQAQSDELFKQIMDMTQGRANEVRNDPVQGQVMNYLKGVLGGKNVPYSNTVLNSLQAQHGRGTAAGEAAQMQSLRDSLGASGGSIYDPSYQAASREAMSQRQGQNLDYAGQLNAQAGVENFNARQGASGMLGQLRGQQNAQINGLTQSAAGFTAGRFYEQPSGTATTPQTLMPQYGGGGQMGMAGQGAAGGEKPAQPKAQMAMQAAPTPQPAPQKQPAPTQQQQQQGLLPHPDMTSGWTRKSFDPNLIPGLMQPRGY